MSHTARTVPIRRSLRIQQQRGGSKFPLEVSAGCHEDIECFTHFNGGTMYRVKIGAHQVAVFRRDDKFDNDGAIVDELEFHKQYTELVWESPRYVKVFIGHDDAEARWGSNYQAHKDGNSLLVELKDGSYVFICEDITSFKPLRGDRITQFFAPVGNSNVPYPFALSATHTYFFSVDFVSGSQDRWFPAFPTSAWLSASESVLRQDPNKWYFKNRTDKVIKKCKWSKLLHEES